MCTVWQAYDTNEISWMSLVNKREAWHKQRPMPSNGMMMMMKLLIKKADAFSLTAQVPAENTPDLD